VSAKLSAHALNLLQYKSRMLEQTLASWRQRHTATIPHKKQHTKGLLHAANAGTGRR
jgi:hypothetical protein